MIKRLWGILALAGFLVLLFTILSTGCAWLPWPPDPTPTPTPTPPPPPPPEPVCPECPAGQHCDDPKVGCIDDPLPPPPPPIPPTCVPDTTSFTLVQAERPIREAEVITAKNRVCAKYIEMFTSADCLALADWDGGPMADLYFELVGAELRADGICAGQPIEGGQRIDKLAVQATPSLWEMYHLVNYGSGQLLTVHNAWWRGGTWGNPGPLTCPPPDPPALHRINAKIHLIGGPWTTLDSTPLVKNADYCRAVGFPDRLECPVRPEGDPNRVACELVVLGGGEKWYWTADNAAWKRVYETTSWPQRINPANSFQLQVAKGIPGWAKVCDNDDRVCDTVEVPVEAP